MIARANAALLFLWSFAAVIPLIQAAPLAHGREPYRPLPRGQGEDGLHLARSLGHSIVGELDSILERSPYLGVFNRHNVHVYRSLPTMPKDIELACRERGGTPEVENGHAICTMSPEPFRKSVFHLQHTFSTKRRPSRMSHDVEMRCRDRGGTPEMVHGVVSCEMNPTPERKVIHSAQAIFKSHNSHGRRGWFDKGVDQVELELPDHDEQ